MSVQFTPGPWIAKDVVGAGLEIYADLRPVLGNKYSEDFPIFKMFAYEQWVQFPSEQFTAMQHANARLIAAAPDLLKACHQAIAALKGREHDGFLRDAIAKAVQS